MVKLTAAKLIKIAKQQSTLKRKKTNEWFFKTGPGEYGEGDQFIGLAMPQCRKLAKEYEELTKPEIKKLLDSPMHEVRMLGLLILVNQFESTKDAKVKKSIYSFYWKNRKAVNNWDLVDVSAPRIIGGYLLDVDKSEQKKLKQWAKSKNMWERRIAIVCTWYFNRNSYTKPTFTLSKALINDKEDLIHKACGWMLREAGKKDEKALLTFLEKNYQKLPRTTLRYAIERFPGAKRKALLRGKF